jgi:ABC-type Fe3+/spermidine/putrescine transport system ATPase subunit
MSRVLTAMAMSGLVMLAGCGEIDQTAKTEKVYAGKKDARAADGAQFGGDKKKWEAALAQRSNTQNEYLRTDVKK